MSFLTFLIYFFISHLIYTVVLSCIGLLFEYNRRRRYKKAMNELLSSGNLQILDLTDSKKDDGQWH